MAKARNKPRPVMHPFMFPAGAYPGEAVGTPPKKLPNQNPGKTQGGAPAGRFFSNAELPVHAATGTPAKVNGSKPRPKRAKRAKPRAKRKK